MVSFARKLNVGLKRKRQDMLSRMQDNARETIRVAKKPVKKDRNGNIDMNDAVHNAGSVAWNTYITALDLDSVLLLWLAQKFVQLGFDNKVISFLRRGYANQKIKKNKEGKDRKLSKFTKNSPRISAYLTYYLMLTAVTSGVYSVYNKNGLKEDIKDKIENIKTRFTKETEYEEDEEYEIYYDQKYESGTFGAYIDKLETITPFVIAGLIEYEGVRVNKDGLHVVYDDATGKPLAPGSKPKGTATIGFGSTVLKDGTKVTSDTKPITTEQAYELARWHLEEGETYFGMYCYDKGFETVNINSVGEAVAIADVMYNGFSNLIEPKEINKKPNYVLGNRFAVLRDSYRNNGAGFSDEEVVAAFKKYPATNKYSFGKAWLEGKTKKEVANTLGNFVKEGPGLWSRRWIEAGLLIGDITPEVLLNCPMDGLATFRKYKGDKKSAFWKTDANGNSVVNRDTYAEFLEWLKHPINEKGESIAHWKKVRDYMPDYALAACDGKVCKLGDKAPKKQRVRQKKVERETYVLDYKAMYIAAVEAYKSGDYISAKTQFEILSTEYPDNALLHNDLAATCNHLGLYDEAIKHAQKILYNIGDRSQYAAAQYNAGFAYEQLGNLQKALDNYQLSVKNGNWRVKSNVNRISRKIQKKKSKATSFNDAAGRVKQKMKDIENFDVTNVNNNTADRG